MSVPRYPSLHQINTRVWFAALALSITTVPGPKQELTFDTQSPSN